MNIPSLPLNSTFSVPIFTPPDPPSSEMCKYTIHTLECGHAAEGNVDTRSCPAFDRTGVHYDRDNPANKDHMKIKTQSRNGICDACLCHGTRAVESILQCDTAHVQGK